MGTVEVEAAVYKKLHDRREEHVELARRARDCQCAVAELQQALDEADTEIRSLKSEIYDDWM